MLKDARIPRAHRKLLQSKSGVAAHNALRRSLSRASCTAARGRSVNARASEACIRPGRKSKCAATSGTNSTATAARMHRASLRNDEARVANNHCACHAGSVASGASKTPKPLQLRVYICATSSWVAPLLARVALNPTAVARVFDATRLAF